MHEENHTLYLTVVDGRVHGIEDIENLAVAVRGRHPVRIRDFARVERGPEPVFNVVTADGRPAVLLNVRSQPDGSTLDIASGLRQVLRELQRELPPDMKLAFFYDQSSFVRASVGSVWEAILFGLLLSVLILYLFLKNWGTTLTAIVVIPVTVLITLVAMRLAGLTFNLMTLGGIAAAIGLVIDDAIVVVEAIYAKIAGRTRRASRRSRPRIGEIFRPLVGSTLTPVVVFIPLAFLDGITGVFFRALALTMVVSLLTSLVLAVTLTPSLAAWFIRDRAELEHGHARESEEGGFLLRRVSSQIYEVAVRAALRHRWLTLGACAVVLALGRRDLPSSSRASSCPRWTRAASSSTTSRRRAPAWPRPTASCCRPRRSSNATAEVESYSRRTGARLALAIAEPNTGDFLVKLEADRKQTTEEVISELRAKFNAALPGVEWEFPGILGDLIGDLMWSPQPIEVKLFSTDIDFLKRKAPEIEARAGPDSRASSIRSTAWSTPGRRCSLRVRHADAATLRPDRGRRRGGGEHRHARPDRLVGARGRPRRQHPRAGGPAPT